jgi:dipeptidyl aminopeptidase/acylaminoacyl peptidase
LRRAVEPLRQAEALNALVMHGGADTDIPPSQSARMDAELTRLGTTHDYIEFEGQQHVIGGRGAERDAATVAWFKRFDQVHIFALRPTIASCEGGRR